MTFIQPIITTNRYSLAVPTWNSCGISRPSGSFSTILIFPPMASCASRIVVESWSAPPGPITSRSGISKPMLTTRMLGARHRFQASSTGKYGGVCRLTVNFAPCGLRPYPLNLWKALGCKSANLGRPAWQSVTNSKHGLCTGLDNKHKIIVYSSPSLCDSINVRECLFRSPSGPDSINVALHLVRIESGLYQYANINLGLSQYKILSVSDSLDMGFFQCKTP